MPTDDAPKVPAPAIDYQSPAAAGQVPQNEGQILRAAKLFATLAFAPLPIAGVAGVYGNAGHAGCVFCQLQRRIDDIVYGYFGDHWWSATGLTTIANLIGAVVMATGPAWAVGRVFRPTVWWASLSTDLFLLSPWVLFVVDLDSAARLGWLVFSVALTGQFVVLTLAARSGRRTHA